MKAFAWFSRPDVFLATIVATLMAGSPVLAQQPLTMQQVLRYPFVSGLTASKKGDRFAWVENVNGIRNIWAVLEADGVPHQLADYTTDDGQELTQLTFSSDGSRLLYVRGGDHDENWPAKGNLAPDPDNSPVEPKITIWSTPVTPSTGAPVRIAEGDGAALSSKGQLAYVNNGQIWTADLSGSTGSTGSGSTNKPERLFFDRGSDSAPVWSPDGTQLAFVSGRDDHSFVGIFKSSELPLLYVAPSTSFDSDPVWSPDGRSIAFMRQPSQGDVPENFLVQQPHPFAFWTADAATGIGHSIWSSPDTLGGSLPDLAEEEPLFWMADNKLVFMAEIDNWPHLYAIDATGGEARLLTPGAFMVEDVSLSPDRRTLVYSANTGHTAGDEDRRHLFRVGTDGRAAVELTSGEGLEWSPAALAEGKVAYVSAGARQTPTAAVLHPSGKSGLIETPGAKEYPSSALVIPALVHYQSLDGLTIEGQLFRSPAARGDQPAVIFVHGGPPRQMLLGWHYMDYYSNAYAVNQYLATHGFTVLSINYRLGIGYGRAFQHPAHAGPAGASEYQDVLAAGRWLQHQAGVDGSRIGIWGGSYGGYLTGLALARNSDVFRAGVDFHGLSNWVPALAKDGSLPERWDEVDASWKEAVATAFAASPDADIATWRSPVLLIQGDDDRNVPFDQTVDLAHRLEQKHVGYEELVIPNEIHGFLRRADWRSADEATARFFSAHLGGDSAGH